MTDCVQICFFLHRAKYGTDSYFPKILGTANFVANAVDFFFTSSRTIFKNSLLFII